MLVSLAVCGVASTFAYQPGKVRYGREAGDNESDFVVFPPDYGNIPAVKRVKKIEDGAGRGTASGGTRQFKARKFLINSQLQKAGEFYYKLHDYGCYCVATEEEGKNRGSPVDQFDHACKRHQQCYQCVFTDFSCNPKSSGYKYKLSKHGDGSNQITCLNTADTCQRSACECDKALAVELGHLVMTNGIQKEFRDYDGEQCGVKKQNAPRPDAAGGGDSFAGGDGGAGGGIGASAFISGDVQNSAIRDTAGFEDPTMGIEFIGGPSSMNEMDNGFGSTCCGSYPKRWQYNKATHQCCNDEIHAIGTC